MCNGSCSLGCKCLSLIISAVAAIVVGALYFNGLITNITTVLWIALGIAVSGFLFLAAALIISGLFQSIPLSSCLCSNGRCLLIGIIGTVLSVIVALSFTLAVDIFSTVIVALAALFTVLTLISLFSLFSCLICGNCASEATSVLK